MLISAFITHKKAEHFSDCQDRFSINSDTKSIALSDGMSQSIFQKYWAEILVNTFTSFCKWVPNRESVSELSQKWRDMAQESVRVQKESGNRSVWRAERSLIDGHSAGATLLGLRFEGLNWECDVLGDSCLILVNDNQIKEIYSSEDVETFDNYPDYFDSNPHKEGKGTPRNFKGMLNTGDTLLMVSDPFSDFLSKKRNNEDETILIDRLLGVNSHSEFEAVVEEWRNMGMHNDDSTLIIIKQGNADSFTLTSVDSIQELIEQDCIKQTNNLSEVPCMNNNMIDVNREEQEPVDDNETLVEKPLNNSSYRHSCISRDIENDLLSFLKKRLKSKYKNKTKDVLVEIIKKITENKSV